ncbi:hypothetical protein [Alistipes sp.]
MWDDSDPDGSAKIRAASDWSGAWNCSDPLVLVKGSRGTGLERSVELL